MSIDILTHVSFKKNSLHVKSFCNGSACHYKHNCLAFLFKKDPVAYKIQHSY